MTSLTAKHLEIRRRYALSKRVTGERYAATNDSFHLSLRQRASPIRESRTRTRIEPEESRNSLQQPLSIAIVDFSFSGATGRVMRARW